MNKKKFLILLSIFCLLVLSSCDGATKPPLDDKPWDDLGGGQIGDQTDESGITSGDIENNDKVEKPNVDIFDSKIEGAINIDLNNLSSESTVYEYSENVLSIKDEGIYALSGTLNGALVVKGDANSITIILYNATIWAFLQCTYTFSICSKIGSSS